MENLVQNFIQVQFNNRTQRTMSILKNSCDVSKYFKIKVPKCLKLSQLELGEKCLTLFYFMITLASFLKLIPFKVVENTEKSVKLVETNNYNELNTDSYPNPNSETKKGKSSESVIERRFEKFTCKSWQIYVYYFVTIIFYMLNMYKWYFFLKPMIVSFHSDAFTSVNGNESESNNNDGIIPGNYHRHLEVDIYFSGHAIFVVASSFALILKTTLLFSVDDLIILLNDVERTQRHFQKDHRLQIRNSKMNTTMSHGSRFCSSVNLTMIHQKKKKSAWYYSIEGIVAVFGAFYCSYSAHVLITIVSIFEFRFKVYKDQPVDILQIFLLMAQISCTFIDLTLCIVSVCILIVIIVTFKIQLKDFEKHAMFHALQNKGKQHKFFSRLEQFLIYYRHLQLVNVYANGYLRHIYFPFYVVSMTFGLLVFTYVSLTAYEYLPIIIYLFFPGLALFVFAVMITIALSQVANIYRLSKHIQNRIFSHRGFSLEFQEDRNQSQDDSSSTERLPLIERVKIIGKQQVEELHKRERWSQEKRYSEKAYLHRYLRTIRPFGFQFGNLGLIAIDTPNLMILTACNYLLVILS